IAGMRIWLLLFLISTVFGEERVVLEEPEDTVIHNEWIDPNDPTRGMDLTSLWMDPNDPSNTAGRPSDASLNAAHAYGGRADASIKRILNGVFHELKVDPSQGADFRRKAEIRLDGQRLQRISSFLDAKTENDWAAHERLCADLEGMITVIEEDAVDDFSWSSMVSVMEAIQPYIGMANLFVLLPAAFILLRMLIGTRSLLLVAFWCFFAFSIYTTYDRRYKEEVSARLEASALYRDSCRPPTFLESSLEYVKGFVSIARKSECRRFIESQQKSIVSEIQLTEVIAEVIFNGIFSAIPVLGTKLRLFFINFYGDMPVHIAIISSVMTVVLLFFCMGYSLKLPFTSFEPHRGPSAIASTVSAAASVAAEALLPNDDLLFQPALQSIQEAARLPSLPYRRPEKRQLPQDDSVGKIEWETTSNREKSREREEKKRDSWVTPRSTQRRSRMSLRKEEGEERYRSISLPRKYM
ncbi:hypothetical protein PENTCL1PPCAC_26824, partial [Pristionchus entomophagus]